MKDFELKVIEELIRNKCIPTAGIFQITEQLLSDYIRIYGILNSTKNGKLNNTNYKFARRLAGRTLVKFLSEDRSAKLVDIRSGLVYMISNPAFPARVKIGMTMDVEKRLAQYQTYDPYRSYKIERYNFVLDRRNKEKQILTSPELMREGGEWVQKVNADSVFLNLVK